MKTLLSSMLTLGMLLVLLMVAPPAMAIAEGKLQAAVGELTGDNSMKIKGEVKQGQSAALSTRSDIKRGAKKIARKLSDASDHFADKLS